MKNIVLKFPSVTIAMKAKRLLGMKKIAASLMKLDPLHTKSGCTHALEIDYTAFYEAIAILRKNSITYSVLENTK